MRGLEGSVGDMAIGVSELAGILLVRIVESRMEVHVVQINGQGCWAVVVVDLAVVENGMANAQIEDAGVAVAVAALMVGILETPFLSTNTESRDDRGGCRSDTTSSEDRDDADADFGVLQLQKRRIRVRGWLRQR